MKFWDAMKTWLLGKIKEDTFPKHKCGMYLAHNAHKDMFMPMSEYIGRYKMIADDCEFENDQHIKKAPMPYGGPIPRSVAKKVMEGDEVWELSWFPEDRNDSRDVTATTLSELLKKARKVKK